MADMKADAIIERVSHEVIAHGWHSALGKDDYPYALTAALVALYEAEHGLREMSRMENTSCGCFDEEPFVFASEDWDAAHKKHNEAYANAAAIIEGSETP
jgi:hypothetical protein